jgi:hypothetical protein
VVDWPAPVYFADTKFFTRSALKLLAKKPHKFYRRWILGEPVPDDDGTEAMEFGTNAHLALLEPDEWLRRVRLQPLPKKANMKMQAFYELWRKVLAERDAVSPLADPISVKFNDFYRLCCIRESVQQNVWARQLLEAPGKNEQTILWCDRETGLMLKVRLDRFGKVAWPGSDWIPDGWVIPDLKTSKDPSKAAFGKDAFNLDYDFQAAFYTDAAEALVREPCRFYLIATDSDPTDCDPEDYETWVYRPTAIQLAKARARYKALLLELLERQFTNDWRAPWKCGVSDLDLPNWSRRS